MNNWSVVNPVTQYNELQTKYIFDTKTPCQTQNHAETFSCVFVSVVQGRFGSCGLKSVAQINLTITSTKIC